MASDACHSQASKPPGSTPTGMSATRKSGIRCSGQLSIEAPLDPGMEGDAIGVLVARRAPLPDRRDRGTPRASAASRPRGARSGRTKTAQRSSAAPRSARQASNVARSAPAVQMRSSALILSAATRDRSIRRSAFRARPAAASSASSSPMPLGAGNLLDPQVQRAAESSRARVVGAGLGLRARVRRTERPDGEEACPCRLPTTPRAPAGRQGRRSPSCSATGWLPAGSPSPTPAGRPAGGSGRGR